MKANNNKTSQPSKEHVSGRHPTETNSLRLGAFFDLLLKIDKRNHPEKYDHHQKHTDSADQAAPMADCDCSPGI